MAPLSSLDFGQMPLSRGASLTWSSDYEPDVKPIIIIIIIIIIDCCQLQIIVFNKVHTIAHYVTTCPPMIQLKVLLIVTLRLHYND